MALNRQKDGNIKNSNELENTIQDGVSLDLTIDQLEENLRTLKTAIYNGTQFSADENLKAASANYTSAIKGLIALNNMINTLIENNKLNSNSSLKKIFDKFCEDIFNIKYSPTDTALFTKLLKDIPANSKNKPFPLLEAFLIKNIKKLFQNAVIDYIKEGHAKKNIIRAEKFLTYTESDASLADMYIDMLAIINSSHAQLKATLIRYLAWQYDLKGKLEESTAAVVANTGVIVGGAVIAVVAAIAIEVITEGNGSMATTTMEVASAAMDIASTTIDAAATSMMVTNILSDLEDSLEELDDQETLNTQVKKKLRVLIEEQGMVEVLVGSSTTVWMKKEDVKDIFAKLKDLAISVANLISKKDLNKDPDKLDAIRKAITTARNRHELRLAVSRLEKSCADFIGTNPIEALLKTIINQINRFEAPRPEDYTQMRKVFKIDIKKTKERVEALAREFRSWKFNTDTITGTGLYEETASLGLDPLSSSLYASIDAIKKVIQLEVTNDTFEGINQTLDKLGPEIDMLRVMYAEQENEEAVRQRLFGEAMQKTDDTQKLAQRTLALIEKLFADYGTLLTKDLKKIHKVIDKARHLANILLDEDRLIVKMYKDDGIDPSYEQIKEQFARVQQLYKLIASRVEKRNAKVAAQQEQRHREWNDKLSQLERKAISIIQKVEQAVSSEQVTEKYGEDKTSTLKKLLEQLPTLKDKPQEMEVLREMARTLLDIDKFLERAAKDSNAEMSSTSPSQNSASFFPVKQVQSQAHANEEVKEQGSKIQKKPIRH